MPRGILTTITAKLSKDIDGAAVRAAYEDRYRDEEFVSVLPEGQLPRTSSVIGSNAVQIQVAVDEHTKRLVVSCVLDNLGKGAASQAIQNANIICGFEEGSGLSAMGVSG
jgi:N-acetyl-gamma-glutamyl-phosphate reductase